MHFPSQLIPEDDSLKIHFKLFFPQEMNKKVEDRKNNPHVTGDQEDLVTIRLKFCVVLDHFVHLITVFIVVNNHSLYQVHIYQPIPDIIPSQPKERLSFVLFHVLVEETKQRTTKHYG